jgi:hypothetical protein
MQGAPRAVNSRPGSVRGTWLEAGQGGARSRRRMSRPGPFKWFKTSPEIIRLAAMLYVRFPLSLRNVEDLLNECQWKRYKSIA